MAPTLRGNKQKQGADPKQVAIQQLAANLDDHLQRIVTCTNIIEAPVKVALKQAQQAANALNDATISQKASAKFQRIFGEMFSALDLIRTNLAPIIAETTAARDGDKVLDKKAARMVVEALSAALPLIRSGFKSIDPKGHESALEIEIQKQGHFLTQLKSFMQQQAASDPAMQKKLSVAARGAEFYIENLKVLSDPSYADRVSHNTDRALNQHVPAAIAAAKALATEFGATEKAASYTSVLKRINTVSKRLVLLAYLQSKSIQDPDLNYGVQLPRHLL